MLQYDTGIMLMGEWLKAQLKYKTSLQFTIAKMDHYMVQFTSAKMDHYMLQFTIAEMDHSNVQFTNSWMLIALPVAYWQCKQDTSRICSLCTREFLHLHSRYLQQCVAFPHIVSYYGLLNAGYTGKHFPTSV